MSRMPFDDVDPRKFTSGMRPDDGEEDAEHHFRHQEERKHVEEEVTAEQEPVGEMECEFILLGAMAVDSRMSEGSQVKHFLTKSSALLTASEGVGELMPDLWFDACDELEEQREAAQESLSEWQLVSQSARLRHRQAVIGRMLQRLASLNVARRLDLIPPNLCVTGS